MSEKIQIMPEQVKTLWETPYLNLYDLQYGEGKHYFDASRNKAGKLAAVLTEEQAKNKTADAVNVIAILKVKGEEPKLLLTYEYRYPTGQILLSPPAGMLDPADGEGEQALFTAAKRELHEETGLTFKETDRAFIVNPLVWSTPGLTDEANALVALVLEPDDLSELNQSGACGTELFYGFEILNKEAAKKVLKDGRDKNGMYYPVFTWCALSTFVSGMWEEE